MSIGKAIVIRNHTLGTILPNNTEVQILRSLYSKGGYLESQCPDVCPMPFSTKDWYYATEKDFSEFRVHCHPDYIQN